MRSAARNSTSLHIPLENAAHHPGELGVRAPVAIPPRDGRANFDVESGLLARDRCPHAGVFKFLAREREPGLQVLASITQLLKLLLLRTRVGRLTLVRNLSAVWRVGVFDGELIDRRLRHKIFRNQLALPIYLS